MLKYLFAKLSAEALFQKKDDEGQIAFVCSDRDFSFMERKKTSKRLLLLSCLKQKSQELAAFFFLPPEINFF